MIGTWCTGNAGTDVDDHRGWILGHFIDPSEGEPRSTTDLEAKWAVNEAAELRTVRCDVAVSAPVPSFVE